MLLFIIRHRFNSFLTTEEAVVLAYNEQQAKDLFLEYLREMRMRPCATKAARTSTDARLKEVVESAGITCQEINFPQVVGSF